MSTHFPQELLVEILHKLPPKTLLKFTSVCKSWRSLITSPSFISLHRNHSPTSLLIQLSISDSIISSLRRDDHFLTQTSSLRLPSLYNLEFSVAGICHGLVCIVSNYDDLIICNPSLRLAAGLPKPSYYDSGHSVHVAFGFDSRNNDYKVVRFAPLLGDQRFRLPPQVEVYSLSSDSWNPVVTPVVTLCCVDSYCPYGLVDGVVHWGAKRRSHDRGWWDYFVLTFNFEDEVFGEVMLPVSLARINSGRANVTVVGGGGDGKTLTIYYMDGCSLCSCDIWVMKEYGVVGSWNKVFSFSLLGFNLEAPSLGVTLTGLLAMPVALFVRKGGEVLLIIDDVGKERLYSLDIERETITDLQIGREGSICCLYSGYYAESLVLLDKASSLVPY